MSYALSLLLILFGPLVDPRVIDTPQYREALTKVMMVVPPAPRASPRPPPLPEPTEEDLEPQPLRPPWETDPTFPCPPQIPSDECASSHSP